MRIARRVVHVLAVVLVLLVGATAAAVIVAETSWFKDWLRGYIVREANQYLNGQLSISRLGGNLFTGVELENVGVSMDGSQVVAVQDLGLKYNVIELLTKGLSVDDISLNKPVIYLRRDGDSWSIARLMKRQTQEADRQGPTSPIAFDHIGISDASLIIDGPVVTSGVNVPARIDDVDADLAFKYQPVRYSLDISHVSFRASQPSIGLNALSGGVAVKDDTLFVNKLALRTEETSIQIDGAVQHYLTNPNLNLKVTSDKVSLPEIARLVPSLAGIPLQPAFEVALDGTLDRLGINVNVRSDAGQLTGKLTANAAGPDMSVSGDVSVRHLNLAPIVRDPGKKSDLGLDATLDLATSNPSDTSTLHGTASVTSPRIAILGYAAEDVSLKARFDDGRADLDGRANAYGASATIGGSATLPKGTEGVRYDLHGTARHVQARRLPASAGVPPVETDLNVDYTARGAEPTTPGQPRAFDAALTFGESSAAGTQIAKGSTARLAVRGAAMSYEADATVSGADVQRIGRELQIPELADGKYQSRINGQVSLKGRGTTLADLDIAANGSITDSTVLGGHIPHASFEGALLNDAARITADGDFTDLDPAVASGNPQAKGTLAGHLDVDASVDGVSRGVSADNVAATVRATLEPSKAGDLDIAWANLDADYQASRGEIRDLEVVGRDLNVSATGPISIDESGVSHLSFHADTPNLAEVGKLAGVAVEGIAKVDGTVTGNKADMQIAGTVAGSDLKYGEDGSTGALSASATFTAHVPQLDYTKATAEADTTATFASIGGQDVNELSANTKYAGNQLSFDATAKQPKRELAASGGITFQPDAQEIRLEHLTLGVQGQQWQLVTGAPATIRYANDSVAVQDVRLVSGDQTISASGTFGPPGSSLTVKAENVDLASVNALMLRPPQLSGRLNASAVASGTKDAPDVKADFQVTNGGFQQFHYDTLDGSASYGGSRVTVDARLQQNASQWLAVKGELPTALFGAGASTSNEPIDLSIDSSPVDLGVVQGFTNQLANVAGTFEAHLRLEGSAREPRPTGSVTLENGAATVSETGVAYSHMAGRVDVQGDHVHIDEITVLDHDNNALSITGDLAVNERQLGGVELYVNADDFKVLGNKVGDVHMRSNLEITGNLAAPDVRGDLGVSTGKLDLDELMALAGASPYATQETEYQTPAAGAAETKSAATTAPLSGYDALTVDVGLSVPNDFIVKASNLQSPGAPIGLGALNVTIGGDLRATKSPGDVVRVRGSVNTV
ncbi:MAG TPA: translocation/assembly module TamB domain-containing protein, partial [Vicinamibacterales bacterium]|nr:translocation/assembly module TamB domain-containing protein [Vicinamibacterales bacterium]